MMIHALNLHLNYFNPVGNAPILAAPDYKCNFVNLQIRYVHIFGSMQLPYMVEYKYFEY